MNSLQKLGPNSLVAQTLGVLGDVARCQNDYERAGALYAEGLKLYQAMGSEGRSGIVFHNLAYVALNRRDYDRAAALFAEALGLFRGLADNWGATACIEGLAGVLGAHGAGKRAAQLLGAAEALREANGALRLHADRAEQIRMVAAVRAQLDEASFNAAWAKGRAMTMEQAITYALAADG